MIATPALTAVAAAPALISVELLFFGPLTPIIRFLVPLVLLVAVIYVVSKILT